MAKIKTWAWWLTHPTVNFDHMIGDLRWQRTRLRSAYKRARYGYSAADMAIWGYDGSMMTWTGKSMIGLTQYQHGHPGSYPDLDSWNQDCLFYGNCLVVGGDTKWTKEDIAWAKAAFPDLWEKESHFINGRLFDRNRNSTGINDTAIMMRVSHEIGRIGLVWLSDNYGSLWD